MRKPGRGEVIPGGIRCRNESDLLFASPGLDLLLSLDGAPDIAGGLEVDQAGDAISSRELAFSVPMLRDANEQVIRDTDI